MFSTSLMEENANNCFHYNFPHQFTFLTLCLELCALLQLCDHVIKLKMLPGEVDIPNWPTKASGVALWQDLIEKMDRDQNSPSVPVLMGTNSYWVVSFLPSPHLNLPASVVWVEFWSRAVLL